MNILILAGAGIISGFLSGYLGVGAAIILIPILTGPSSITAGSSRNGAPTS